MLPGGEKAKECIRTKFTKEFANTSGILELELQVIDTHCKAANEAGPQRAEIISIAALTKLAHQHFAVCVLCERGLVGEADLIVRAMFEVVLVIRGLLSEGLELPKRSPEQRPSVELRAKLVLAKMAIDRKKYSRTNPSLSSTAMQNADTRVKDAKSLLGPQWFECASKWEGWFGFRGRDLAKKVGLEEYYDVVYRWQSSSHHASDLDHFVLFADEGFEGSDQKVESRWFPDCELASSPMELARELVRLAMLEVDRHFDLKLRQEIMRFCTAQDSE